MTRTVSRQALALGLLASLALLPSCSQHKQRKLEDARVVGAEAQYRRGIEEMAHGNLRRAKMFLDGVQYATENRKDVEPAVRLALADLAFYSGDPLASIEARAKYLDFVTLYGDHPRAPYAQLQAGVCSLKEVGRPMRDQSQTVLAIQDLREVGRRFPDSPYARVAEQLVDRAEANLAEHDFLVGRFYYNRKAYLAASDRFRSVLDNYPHFRSKEKVYFYLGQALLRMNNDAEGRIYLDKIVTDYPDGEFASQAKRLLAHEDASGERGTKKG